MGLPRIPGQCYGSGILGRRLHLRRDGVIRLVRVHMAMPCLDHLLPIYPNTAVLVKKNRRVTQQHVQLGRNADSRK